MSNSPIVEQKDVNLPLPLIVAEKWGFQLQRYEPTVSQPEYLFSIQDWICGLSSTKPGSARKTWEQLRSEFQTPTFKLLYFTDGGTFRMDFTTDQGLYEIAQNMRPMKKRPQLEEIRLYLAKAGVLVDRVRRDAGAAAELVEDLERRHAEVRAKGKHKRINFTQTARETHVKNHPDYAALTNAEYQELFGAAKDELVKTLSLTPAQANRFRDHISTLALQAIDAAETAGAIKMKQLGRRLTTPEQLEIVRHAARLIAPGFWALAEYLEIDLLSGNPRLSSGEQPPLLS
jgi:hypothetical protein